MRCRQLMLAGLVSLASASLSHAQQQASSFFTGVPTTQIKNTPLDTSRAIIQHPAQSALTSNRFDFSRLFSRMTIPSFPPKTGVSNLPSPSSFPSTRYQNYKMVGQPPFLIRWMFGNNQPSPIAPVAPIIPNNNAAPVGPGSG